MERIFQAVQAASRSLNLLNDGKINEILNAIADEAILQTTYILAENQKDLERMDKNDPKYDRLLLSADRIRGIAGEMRNVSGLPTPLGLVLTESVRPNGMEIFKVTVPFGVIGVIYEARPNVSFDVFSLCFKSGNACILKGGSDAEFSNKAIVSIIRNVLEKYNVNPDVCVLLPADRESATQLLNAVGYIDLLIPRGSQGLIEFVRNHSKVPVIETGAGICHTFFDESGNLEIGQKIIYNAKTRRVSVCNALDCLIIHQNRLPDLAGLCKPLSENQVIIYADKKAYAVLKGTYPSDLLLPAMEDSFGIEFLDYKMSVKTVSDINEAIGHISRYSSRHSECIVSEDENNIALFEKMVDAACVYSNVSTAFTDGAQFGFGAEIGISTQKLHARGPMALRELTSYKYLIRGNGQIRNS